MDIFAVLSLIGGLALFLFGMNTMGDGLVKVSGGKLEYILEKLTARRITAVLLGAGVTAVIQSSSATTVMVVGFVNSGLMQLSAAVGVIMGANIGTTVTSWLLSLTGIEGSSLVLSLLKPSSFSPVLAMIGVVLTMSARGNTKRKDVGTILLGFAVLMFGMETMSDAVSPLAENEQFTGILTAFSNPVLGMLAGALLTAVIQSSSASVGILQALCATGALPYSAALPIIMGQNIGTCVTALISSIGASRNAKRASMIHLYFNLIGTVVFMAVFYAVNRFVSFAFLEEAASAAGIAVVHSLFNIVCCAAWFPFADVLVKLACLTIPDGGTVQESRDGKEPEQISILDERFLENPGLAVEISRDAEEEMARLSAEALFASLGLLEVYTPEKAAEVVDLEEVVDRYEERIGTYLYRLSGKELSPADSRTVTVLLHCMSDFERISDHAVNIADSAAQLSEKNIRFTKGGQKELAVYSRAIRDIVEKTIQVFAANDLEGARHVEPLEEIIDELSIQMKDRHIERLRRGKCTLESGLIMEDIITVFERVSDHCSNVALCLLTVSADGFDVHSYLDRLGAENGGWFAGECEMLRADYALPSKKKKM